MEDLNTHEAMEQEGTQEALEAFRGPEFFEEEEVAEEAPAQEQEPKEADSARYFQSLYDKSQAEVQQLRQQNLQIMQYLQGLQAQQQQFSTGQAQVNPNSAVRESATSVQAPVRPQRPQNYDPIDAQSNPNSESFKYARAMEDYQEQMADYLETSNKRAIAQAQAAAERATYEMRANAARQQLTQSYGLGPEEVDEFWQMMDDPQTVNLDNLVKLYRVIKGQPERVAQPRRGRSQMPLPPVPTAKARVAETGSPADRIMDDMIRQFQGTQIND